MRLVNVETYMLEEFFYETTPPYAILSHTWGTDNEEVSFNDFQNGKFKKTEIRPIKLEGCCEQAKKDGLRYAWIDTCCIDKTNAVELGEAINSMFRWYKDASICYTYLSDVPADDNHGDPKSKFFSSRWFTRGWTLQELLAPKKLCFYNLEWQCIGTRNRMSVLIEKITGIPCQFLQGRAELHEASVAQRMSWAANRVTKRKEDIAYCLLGIFDVTMSMIYGEGSDQAFSRLQQEIMKEVRDDSILAWGLSLTNSTPKNSTDIISGGVLAAAPSDFANCGHIVSRDQDTTNKNSFDIFGGSLRAHLPLFRTPAGEIFGLLQCGPKYDPNHVVGIPLNIALSKGRSDEYVRPQGHYSILLPEPTSEIQSQFIHIKKGRQNSKIATMDRRYWFYIEESVELELIEVEPEARWQKDNAMIMTENGSHGDVTQRTLTRLRHNEEGFNDFVVVLEFEVRRSQIHARYHVMICSKSLSLGNLAKKFVYIRQEALAKKSASNGILNLYVNLEKEIVGVQPMFVVRLVTMPSLPEVTIDANLELQQLDMKLELAKILKEEDVGRLEAGFLHQQVKKKTTQLDSVKENLREINWKLEKLAEEKESLLKIQDKGAQEIIQLVIRGDEIKQQQDKLLVLRSQAQRHLDNFLERYFHAKDGLEHEFKSIVNLLFVPEWEVNWTTLSWAAANGYKSIVELLLQAGADLEEEDDNNQTPLLLSSILGHENIVRLLLEKGAELESKDTDNQTSLLWAASSGYEDIVKLLLEKGAEIESKDKYNQTPLLWAARHGHTDIVELLLENGAKLESKNKYDQTPLLWASRNGHEAVVSLLLDRGAEFELKDEDNQTPLLWAARNGHETVVTLLLKSAKLESQNNDSHTPLPQTTIMGYQAAVKLLLEKGAKLESEAKGGRRTPPVGVHDIEFAAEISTSLLSQVHHLQALLAEKEEIIKAVTLENMKLKKEVKEVDQRL